MKRKMIVAGICAAAWLCRVGWGQTVVTNLTVMGTLQQGTTSEAAGYQAAALGEGTLAEGDFSHAEGDTTSAQGTASHAEGALTTAGGDQSHAEGEATEALGKNSHAGGAYARARAQDTNSFIHAAGTGTNGMKETQFPDTAHFDRVVTLAPALDASNAVLSRAENDQRYLSSSGGTMTGNLDLGDQWILYVAGVAGMGTTLSFEEHVVSDTNLWGNWNADLLDGLDSTAFAPEAHEHDAQYVNTSGDTMTGQLSISASSNQTNLTIAGWAKIDYVPPQGGISMGIYTNR